MIKSLDKKDATLFLANNYIGNIAYIYNNRPFVVPITYFFDSKNTIIGYSNEGHKINAMRKNANVSLGVSEIKSIYSWKSVLANGTFEELSGSFAKQKLQEFGAGIKDLILRNKEENVHFIGEFSSKIFDQKMSVIFKITIDELIGKICVK